MKNYTHVRLYYKKETKHYYAEITDSKSTIILDLGDKEENMLAVVRLLKEEYGGIYLSPGGLN